MQGLEGVLKVLQSAVFIVLQQIIAGNLTLHLDVDKWIDSVLDVEQADLGVDV